MGLLSRISLAYPGQISKWAGRLGARTSSFERRIAGQRIRLDFDLADLAPSESAALGRPQEWSHATEISWGWPGAQKYERRALAPKQTREVFDGTAARIADEIAMRPPQTYTFQGLTGGHARRYARDLAARLDGTGYRATQVGYQVYLQPTARAYANYAARTATAPALAVGALTAPLWMSRGS